MYLLTITIDLTNMDSNYGVPVFSFVQCFFFFKWLLISLFSEDARKNSPDLVDFLSDSRHPLEIQLLWKTTFWEENFHIDANYCDRMEYLVP